MRTALCDTFGIRYPIFAFSHIPEVVAAVSRAGGLGVLGALRFTPEELETALRWVDDNVEGHPYGVDVVMPAAYEGMGTDDVAELLPKLREMIPDEHRAFVERVLERHGIPTIADDDKTVGDLLGWTDATARPLVDIAFEHPIALLANALGPPPPDIVDRAHTKGVPVAALVGRADQARRQVEVGVDVVVAQGTEAGGHTGEIATMVLVPEAVEAVAPTPVLAAGGIASGRQAAAAIALGAQGVWTGSIWLTTQEAMVMTTDTVRDRLLAATSRDTVRSRSLTGKTARLLKTAWTEAWEAEDSPGTLPMPLQFMLTADALHRIHASGNADLVIMPVGQVVGRMNEVRPVADVIADMVRTYDETVAGLDTTR